MDFMKILLEIYFEQEGIDVEVTISEIEQERSDKTA